MSNPEHEQWFFDPEMTPSQARNSLRTHSAVFAQVVWVDWLRSGNKTTDGERGVVVGALKNALQLGRVVARGMGVAPQDACLASLEVQSGQDYGYLRSMAEIADAFVVHHSRSDESAENVEKMEKTELTSANPLGMNASAAEYKASELIFKSTRRLHGMLDSGEQDMFALGDYLNAMIYTGRIFNQQVGDDLSFTGPEESS